MIIDDADCNDDDNVEDSGNNLIVVRATCRLFDTRILLNISDLHTYDWVHVEPCQLANLYHSHWNLDTTNNSSSLLHIMSSEAITVRQNTNVQPAKPGKH